MSITNDPASPDYQYDGTMSKSDLAAATIARLDKLTPELAILADQLGLLGLTGAAVTVEGLIDSRGIRALVLNAVTEGE